MSLISELRRRNVFRVAAAYLVVGWLLTEVLTTILPTLGAPGWVARAVILVFVFGFVPTVILSWVYELTPEGIKREDEIDRENPAERGKVKRLDYVTIAAVMLGIVFVAFFSARQLPDEPESDRPEVSNESVAVLPFVNMSNDEDNEYFSDGLTETLLHMLAQFPDLKVAARTSSFAFKGQNMDIREIADALQVAHVLEGSVQQAGGRMRVTVQLIRAEDGFHVWSEIYDRTVDDIFAIQDEIATKVGGALSASLLGTGGGSKVSGVGTDNVDAYDMYLQALRERSTFSYGGLLGAEELLKGALTIDPDYLDAKTALAGNYLHQYETGLMGQAEAFTAALAITDQVLSVRPLDPGARAIQLFANASLGQGEASSVDMYETARKLESLVTEFPDEYQARVFLTHFLHGLQQPEKALQLQLDALELDPYNARIYYEIGSTYLELDQLEDARDALNKSLEIEPLQPNAYLRLAEVARQSGDGVDFVQQHLKAMGVDPRDHEIPARIAGFLYSIGLIDAGDDFRKRVVAIAPTSNVAYRIELLRAISIGDESASIASARRAIEDDVDDRQFAYGGAVRQLMRVAAQQDRVAEESAYLEQHAPGILDIDAASVPVKFRVAQRVSFDAWYVSLGHEELMRRLDIAIERARSYGFDPLTDSRSRVAILVLRGETEQAIEIALADVFTEPVTKNMNWQEDYSQAQYAEFANDPRIVAAMGEWASEEADMRDRVKNFLADLSGAS